MNDTLAIKEISIIEWYDGFVSGVLETNKGDYIGILLSFEPGTNHRLFALIPLDGSADVQQIVDELSSLLTQEKSLSQSPFGSRSGVLLTLGLIEKNKTFFIYPASKCETDRIFDLQWPVIEQSVDPESNSAWKEAGERCLRYN
ncbi:hypothetical protein [Brevifollis gellanilyticus]|uniref:Uncharacterized protein n=1 Tax=Brevifollis gellanilyticus TaxID=748831 RepID=A0A512M7F4_9BACT|nr:hypothetical protein [Brevifollis gellanilyticus]GEP42271.1 hypothetical protein BGE01nite_15620 [Brevifollis gellanilyticus]